MKNKLYKRIACSAVAAALLSVTSLASAAINQGTVLKVRSCYDSASTRKVLVYVDRDSGSDIWIYLGVEGAGTQSLSSIATAAMLSGKKIRFANGTSASSYCGSEESVSAFDASSTNYFIEIL